ncbi:MAG: hypothetical protein K2P64_06135 [Lachnospiraceae bacterium]|nr:hypothetical protein [Lachnospiraceae bacterium]
MSYCVHCGVELDASLKKCPLCNTPVLDPNNIPYFEATSPYPSKKGKVEPARKKDAAIFVSVLLLTISITCGTLNWLVFPRVPWSLLVIGFCVVIWVICVPFIFYQKLSPYLAVLFDGMAVSFYLYLISRLTGSTDWLFYLGLPIAAMFTVLLEILMLFILKVNHSFFAVTLYILSLVSLSCIGIELLCRNFLEDPLRITWSAIVLTVCIVFIIAIVTILLLPRVREEARRRLHF